MIPVQSGTPVHASSTTVTATLPSASTPGNLVTAELGFDKNITAIAAAPSGWFELGAPYIGASVGQAVYGRWADGTAADQTFTTTWTTSRGVVAVLREWPFQGSGTPLASAVEPDPPDNATYATLAVDVGSAPAAGLALTYLSVDTWTSGWTGTSVDGGYGDFQGDAYGSGGNGGACIAVASKTVASSDATAVTWTSPSTDQITVRVVVLAESGGGGTPSGGSNTTVTVSATGGGAKVARGGSTATVPSATAGGGLKVTRGGAPTELTVTTTGDGHKVTGSGSGAVLTILTTAVGRKIAQGGSASVVGITTTGGGTNPGGPLGGGSPTTVTVATAGGGHKVTGGGSADTLTVLTTGAGLKRAGGGSAAAVTVSTTGGGTDPGDARDITVTAALGARRWTGDLTARAKTGTLHDRRWTGALP